MNGRRFCCGRRAYEVCENSGVRRLATASFCVLIALGMLGPTGAAAAKAKTTVTIKGWSAASFPGEWSGRLDSEKAKCRKDRYVELFMRAGDKDLGKGNTTAEKVGKRWIWKVPTFEGEPDAGKYFATVTATEDCGRAETKIFRYPADNARRNWR